MQAVLPPLSQLRAPFRMDPHPPHSHAEESGRPPSAPFEGAPRTSRAMPSPARAAAVSPTAYAYPPTTSVEPYSYPRREGTDPPASAQYSTWPAYQSPGPAAAPYPRAGSYSNEAVTLRTAEPGAFRESSRLSPWTDPGARRPEYDPPGPSSMTLPPLKRPASPAQTASKRPAQQRLSSAHDSPILQESGPAHRPGMESLTYRLRVRQQPQVARACGFGERDRRAVDPPPVVELEAFGPMGPVLDYEELQLSHLVLQTSLWSADGASDVTTFREQTHGNVRRLVGSLVSSPALVADDQNHKAPYFCFPDLSCREAGRYRIKFTLISIDATVPSHSPTAVFLDATQSDIFMVYSPKEFPGMMATTPLTQALKIQGVAIPAKKGRNFPSGGAVAGRRRGPGAVGQEMGGGGGPEDIGDD